MRRSKLFRFLILFSLVLTVGCTKRPGEDLQKSSAKPKVLAFVNVPVTDIVHTHPSKNYLPYSEKRYKSLPCSGVWERIHQLVFNDPVYILKEYGHEVFVEAPGIYWIVNGKPRTIKGWMLKKNTTPISAIQKRRFSNASFPDPLGLGIKKGSGPEVALVAPYKVQKAGITLSAGTHFVIEEETPSSFQTSIWDAKKQTFQSLSIPKRIALAKVELSKEAAIERFVKLIRFWSTQKQGFIPYVLGGCSWLRNYEKLSFNRFKGADRRVVIDRAEKVDGQHSGFDCSSLVYTAAKMAGIPYECKNTVAIRHMLKPMRKNERIEKGDLILVPGHVAVISSVNPLKIAQARGYSSGIGRIYESEGRDQILGVRTVQDLQALYTRARPLPWKKKRDQVMHYKNWSIVKIRSSWQAFGSRATSSR